MKADTHPDYHMIKVVMTNGQEFMTRSTYGEEGATLHLDIDPNTHPAWTGGSQQLLDRGGRLSRFNTRFAGLSSAARSKRFARACGYRRRIDVIAPPPLALDAGAGLGERLARHFHRPAVGVQQRRRVAHDADVALPEHEIAAPQMRERVVERQRRAERRLLHVAVARRGDSRRRQRGLRQAGAVDPFAGAPAPQIGRLEKTLGDGDEIGLARVDRREMPGVEEEAVVGDGEIAFEARDFDERAERQREARRPLDRRRRDRRGCAARRFCGSARAQGPSAAAGR